MRHLENVETPKDAILHSYSQGGAPKLCLLVYNPNRNHSNPIQWQDPWPPQLRSLALQTSESGLCGMVLIGDLDSMIPGPKPRAPGPTAIEKNTIYS